MPERNWGCRISLDHTYKGYRMAVLENDQLRVSVLLDKGADIVEFSYKPAGVDPLWWTPWGLHPSGKMLPSTALDYGIFGDYYEGGMQEIFPSGGAPNTHQGVEYGLHGEVSLQPWEARVLKDTEDEIVLELGVTTYRSPFRLTRRMSMQKGKAALFMEHQAENLSAQAVDAMWGLHPALGAPFLNEDCRVDLPGARCVLDHNAGNATQRFPEGTDGPWPRLKGKDGRWVDLSRFPKRSKPSADMFYLTDLKGAWYGVTDAKKKVGFGMAWDAKVWPHLWFWQIYGGSLGAPFWGRTYNCALEPFSGWPTGLDGAAKNGTALRFGPRQVKRGWSTMVGYHGRSKLSMVRRDGTVG